MALSTFQPNNWNGDLNDSPSLCAPFEKGPDDTVTGSVLEGLLLLKVVFQEQP
jgi:hypothetical protein